MQNIPTVSFNTQSPEFKGFEIFPFQRIINSAGSLLHDGTLPHRLEFFMLMYYTNGKSNHQVDFKWYPIKPRSLMYLSKGQINSFKFTPGLNGYCMVFTQEFLDHCLGKLPTNVVFRLFTPQLFDPLINVPKENNLSNYIEAIHQEFNSNIQSNKATIIDALFTIILSKSEELLQQQTHYIEESQGLKIFTRFAELVSDKFTQNRNADYYAQQIGITYKHLNVICKNITKFTAKQFIDNYIILEAKRLMVGTDLKSTELAYSLGFEEPTNFTKFFKRHTSQTPTGFLNSITRA